MKQIWFTADTHFGSKRSLELSKRPFKSVEEMDWTMVKNWNERITKNDEIYHLGDFGNIEMIDYLNFKTLNLVHGNYDDKGRWRMIAHNYRIVLLPDNEIITTPEGGDYYRLVHKPEDAGAGPHQFYLFGHIHKLQMIKRNGLNVGVDCHNFCPISLDDVRFYRNAIENHYDGNVFMSELGGQNSE